MIRTVLTLASFGALVFAAGYWFGSERTAEAAANRIYELRTYTTPEGKLPALQARFRNHTVKLFEKHGMANIGYWVPADDPNSNNTLVYILSHKDREAAKQSWAAFRDDSDWKKVREESEKDGKLTTKVESVFLNPTDFSKLK